MRNLNVASNVISWIVFLIFGPSLISHASWVAPVVGILVLILLILWSHSIISSEVIRYVDKAD